MKSRFENLFTSGFHFLENEEELKSKFQLINLAIILSSVSLCSTMVVNFNRGLTEVIPYEVGLLLNGIILMLLLRKSKKFFHFVAFILSLEYLVFFVVIVYYYPVENFKFLWVFTFPTILLYFQHEISGKIWIITLVFFITIAPYQTFFEVRITEFQALYLCFVLITVSVVIDFYQHKMNDSRLLVERQRELLAQQLDELKKKDTLLNAQSKQAVMGEMISMIAHQWRQPLSSVTLAISDIQFKQMFGKRVDEATMDTTLQGISDTIVYLSETIDDFQTYFHPKKERSHIAIDALIQKAISFVNSRLKEKSILIELQSPKSSVETYVNEFTQVLLNILNNAIDELNQLEGRTLQISIGVEEKGDAFIVWIADNGRGIKAENIDKLFDPYFSTKGKNGTGLGLYMSQMIMQKQFNSTIEVESSESGTTFSMRVPKKLS